MIKMVEELLIYKNIKMKMEISLFQFMIKMEKESLIYKNIKIKMVNISIYMIKMVKKLLI